MPDQIGLNEFSPFIQLSTTRKIIMASIFKHKLYKPLNAVMIGALAACGGGGDSITSTATPGVSQLSAATPLITSAIETDSGSIEVKGNAQTGTTVVLTWPDGSTCTATASAINGDWACVSSIAYEPGADVSAGVTNANGMMIESATALIASIVTRKVPHTGITTDQCLDKRSYSYMLVPCSSKGALALNNQQDGHRTQINTMSYSQVRSNPVTSCVKDIVTGLIWEGKEASGKRAGENLYTNYDNTTKKQVYDPSWTISGDETKAHVRPTREQINADTNSIGYVNYVNSIALCGFTNWRLPTVMELQGIIDYGTVVKPSVNKEWFPNTQSDSYWTSVSFVADRNLNPIDPGWVVSLGERGVITDELRHIPRPVRLVRNSR
jgi:Protein of unknown function (DUF1566)